MTNLLKKVQSCDPDQVTILDFELKEVKNESIPKLRLHVKISPNKGGNELEGWLDANFLRLDSLLEWTWHDLQLWNSFWAYLKQVKPDTYDKLDRYTKSGGKKGAKNSSVYVVYQLLDFQVYKGEPWFTICWQDYPDSDNTEEPLISLPQMLHTYCWSSNAVWQRCCDFYSSKYKPKVVVRAPKALAAPKPAAAAPKAAAAAPKPAATSAAAKPAPAASAGKQATAAAAAEPAHKTAAAAGVQPAAATGNTTGATTVKKRLAEQPAKPEPAAKKPTAAVPSTTANQPVTAPVNQMTTEAAAATAPAPRKATEKPAAAASGADVLAGARRPAASNLDAAATASKQPAAQADASDPQAHPTDAAAHADEQPLAEGPGAEGAALASLDTANPGAKKAKHMKSGMEQDKDAGQPITEVRKTRGALHKAAVSTVTTPGTQPSAGPTTAADADAAAPVDPPHAAAQQTGENVIPAGPVAPEAVPPCTTSKTQPRQSSADQGKDAGPQSSKSATAGQQHTAVRPAASGSQPTAEAAPQPSPLNAPDAAVEADASQPQETAQATTTSRGHCSPTTLAALARGAPSMSHAASARPAAEAALATAAVAAPSVAQASAVEPDAGVVDVQGPPAAGAAATEEVQPAVTVQPAADVADAGPSAAAPSDPRPTQRILRSAKHKAADSGKPSGSGKTDKQAPTGAAGTSTAAAAGKHAGDGPDEVDAGVPGKRKRSHRQQRKQGASSGADGDSGYTSGKEGSFSNHSSRSGHEGGHGARGGRQYRRSQQEEHSSDAAELEHVQPHDLDPAAGHHAQSELAGQAGCEEDGLMHEAQMAVATYDGSPNCCSPAELSVLHVQLACAFFSKYFRERFPLCRKDGFYLFYRKQVVRKGQIETVDVIDRVSAKLHFHLSQHPEDTHAGLEVFTLEDPCDPCYNNPYVRGDMSCLQKGVRARKSYAKGDLVGMYQGRLITKADHNVYTPRDEWDLDTPEHAYTMMVSWSDAGNCPEHELLWEGDPNGTCPTVYVNHEAYWGACRRSSDGLQCNCHLYSERKANLEVQHGFRMQAGVLSPLTWMAAVRDIQKGEVLLTEWDIAHLHEMGNAYVRQKLFQRDHIWREKMAAVRRKLEEEGIDAEQRWGLDLSMSPLAPDYTTTITSTGGDGGVLATGGVVQPLGAAPTPLHPRLMLAAADGQTGGEAGRLGEEGRSRAATTRGALVVGTPAAGTAWDGYPSKRSRTERGQLAQQAAGVAGPSAASGLQHRGSGALGLGRAARTSVTGELLPEEVGAQGLGAPRGAGPSGVRGREGLQGAQVWHTDPHLGLQPSPGAVLRQLQAGLHASQHHQGARVALARRPGVLLPPPPGDAAPSVPNGAWHLQPSANGASNQHGNGAVAGSSQQQGEEQGIALSVIHVIRANIYSDRSLSKSEKDTRCKCLQELESKLRDRDNARRDVKLHAVLTREVDEAEKRFFNLIKRQANKYKLSGPGPGLEGVPAAGSEPSAPGLPHSQLVPGHGMSGVRSYAPLLPP